MVLHKIISSLHAKETQKSNLNSDMKKFYTPYTTKLVIIWKKMEEAIHLMLCFITENLNTMLTIWKQLLTTSSCKEVDPETWNLTLLTLRGRVKNRTWLYIIVYNIPRILYSAYQVNAQLESVICYFRMSLLIKLKLDFLCKLVKKIAQIVTPHTVFMIIYEHSKYTKQGESFILNLLHT